MYSEEEQPVQPKDKKDSDVSLGPIHCVNQKQLSAHASSLGELNLPLQRSDTITSLGCTSDTKSEKPSCILPLGKPDHTTDKKIEEFISRQANRSPKLPLYTSCLEKKAMECRFMTNSRLGSNSAQKDCVKDKAAGTRQRLYSEQFYPTSHQLHNESAEVLQTDRICRQFTAGISSPQKSQAYVVESKSGQDWCSEPKTPPKKQVPADRLSQSSGVSSKSKPNLDKMSIFEAELEQHRNAYENYDHAVLTGKRLVPDKSLHQIHPTSPKSGHFSEHKRNSRRVNYQVLLIDFDETIHPTKYKISNGIKTEDDIPPSQANDFYFLDYQVVAKG